MITEEDIVVGDSIMYRLQETDLPTDPNKEWKGKVLSIIPKTDKRSCIAIVVSLEPGYEGLRDIVHLEQIVAVVRNL